MKKVRTTSAAVYRELQPSLQRREQIVLDALKSWRGEAPTSYELTQYLQQSGLAFDLNAVRPRLTSLQAKGFVRTGDRKVCRISGKKAFTWYPSEPRVPLPEPIPQWLNF